MHKIFFLSLLLLCQLAFGQESLQIHSVKNLKTTDSIWIFKPAQYSNTKQYPVVFLLHGHSANYKSWSKLANLQLLADTYNFLIVCPDGLKKSWYINSPYPDSSQYERFFIEELLPVIKKKYTTDQKNYFITGASMGGHGAFWLFLNHPELFAGAGSTSGVLNLRYSAFRKSTLSDLFGPYSDSNQAYDNYSVVNKLKDLKERNKALIFDSGTEDYLYITSKQFRQKCDELKIAATYTAQPGAHTGAYWSKTILQHFRFFSEHLNN